MEIRIGFKCISFLYCFVVLMIEVILVIFVWGNYFFFLCFIRNLVVFVYNECGCCLEMDVCYCVIMWVIMFELKWFIYRIYYDMISENYFDGVIVDVVYYVDGYVWRERLEEARIFGII